MHESSYKFPLPCGYASNACKPFRDACWTSFPRIMSRRATGTRQRCSMYGRRRWLLRSRLEDGKHLRNGNETRANKGPLTRSGGSGRPERTMDELDNRKDHKMAECSLALANLVMWTRDQCFPAAYAHATRAHLAPFFRLSGTLTSSWHMVSVQLRPFHDRQ
jgi:hypothetical protein